MAARVNPIGIPEVGIGCSVVVIRFQCPRRLVDVTAIDAAEPVAAEHELANAAPTRSAIAAPRRCALLLIRSAAPCTEPAYDAELRH